MSGAMSGCLYLDTINHAPSISLDAPLTTYKGQSIEVRSSVGDPDGNPGSVSVELQVTATDGQMLADCDYEATKYGLNFEVTFYRTGSFGVQVIATDNHGSKTPSPIEMVTVLDELPVIPALTTVQQTSTASQNLCGFNTAGDAITIGLVGSPPTDGDADAHGVGCSPTDRIVYTWRVAGQPVGTKPVLTLYDKKNGCAASSPVSRPTLMVTDPTTQICLWTDPMIVGSTEMYSVVFDVTDDPNDPTHTVSSVAGNFSVSADQPPCITGSNPVAGSYVVDRTQLQEFAIDGTADDRDPLGSPTLTFAWSVWRDADPNWRAVPSWTMSTYQLDVSSFDVGEHVRVRAEAVDRTGALVPPSSCPIDADDCTVMSCASPNVCHKWKTWDLELR
jgi:hypothetical protein